MLLGLDRLTCMVSAGQKTSQLFIWLFYFFISSSYLTPISLFITHGQKQRTYDYCSHIWRNQRIQYKIIVSKLEDRRTYIVVAHVRQLASE